MTPKRILTLIIALLLAAPAYAYLDPGSGSIILQGILAAIAGILAAIKLYWRKLKAFFSKLFNKSNKKKKEHNQKHHHED